jgi:hypothetical protein
MGAPFPAAFAGSGVLILVNHGPSFLKGSGFFAHAHEFLSTIAKQD